VALEQLLSCQSQSCGQGVPGARAAFQGCSKLFLLAPNVPNQTQLELSAVETAKSVDLRHIVKLSVLGADEEEFALARVHRPVEREIESSGIAWTFLRPNSFMQNVVTYMGETIKTEAAFYSASGEAKISHVDVRDVAAVALKALIESTHEGKAYNLTGPEALTYNELATELSKVLGRPISHITLSPSDLRSGMLAEGLPEEIVDRMLDLETGTPEGFFKAFDASTGVELWRFQTGSGVIGSPVTWELGGKQYIAVVSGWGGGARMWGGEVVKRFERSSQGGRLWVFNLAE
jgi:uncharacterized protein YbjT (DUF2867 family)